MKIGILTIHHTTNYGATLQAFCLWTVIKQQGYPVEIIDYRPEKAVKFYRKEIKLLLKHHLLEPQSIIYLLKLLIKEFKFNLFIRKNLKLSREKKIKVEKLGSINFPYQAIIVGSDQIWCTNSFRGFDPSFFLDFVSEKRVKKISYAPSFSNTLSLEDNQRTICNLLQKFDFISVRDTQSAALLKNECYIEAQQVLDPTFLINLEDKKN